MVIEGITISEIMEKTGKSRHDVKPVIGEFLYPPDTLDKICEAKVGRPKKATTEPPDTSPTKARKP